MDFAKEVIKRTIMVMLSIIAMGLFMFISLLLIIHNVVLGCTFALITISLFVAYMDLKKVR